MSDESSVEETNAKPEADNELIVNCLPLNADERKAFIDAAGGLRQEFVTTESERLGMGWGNNIPASLLRAATVIVGNPPVDQVRAAPSLRWLQTSSAGVDTYLRGGVLSTGTMITSASGAYGQAVSEHMFAMMWALMKRLPEYRANQDERIWRDAGDTLSPVGASVLVIGTGDIGSHFATLAKAVGATTLGVRRTPSTAVRGVDRMYGFDTLDELLPQVDVVAMVVPATAQTHHLIDARRLRLMNRGAVLINAGRGDAIDCMALAQALEAGDIRAAGLDVTEPEPLPATHPLWDSVNCLITPHVAGGAHLESTVKAVIAIALENLKRYVAGIPPQNRIL